MAVNFEFNDFHNKSAFLTYFPTFFCLQPSRVDAHNCLCDPEVRPFLRNANPNKDTEHSRDLRADSMSRKNFNIKIKSTNKIIFYPFALNNMSLKSSTFYGMSRIERA